MAGGMRFRVGQKVQWGFRGTEGYGKVEGILDKNTAPDDTHYRIQVDPTDRAAHDNEEEFRVHLGADMHPWDGKLPQSVIDQAAKKRAA